MQAAWSRSAAFVIIQDACRRPLSTMRTQCQPLFTTAKQTPAVRLSLLPYLACHTMLAGGPAPGGPRALAFARVAVWRGGAPGYGAPLTEVRSDADGFSSLNLASGVYTLSLEIANGGWGTLVMVRVVAGRPVAAGVYEDVL